MTVSVKCMTFPTIYGLPTGELCLGCDEEIFLDGPSVGEVDLNCACGRTSALG